MNLFLICAGLFFIIVGAAWPIVLVMSYSSGAQLETKLKAIDTESASTGRRFLRLIQNHRMSVAWIGLVLLMLGILV
jgi:hypothetical protein